MLSDRASLASASMLISVGKKRAGNDKTTARSISFLYGLECGANSRRVASHEQHTVFNHAEDISSLFRLTCKQGCGMAYDRVHHEDEGDPCGEVNEPVAIRTSHVRDARQCGLVPVVTVSVSVCLRVLFRA